MTVLTKSPPAPARRLRRLRRTEGLRSLVREYSVDTRSLVLPLFVYEGGAAPQPVESMPGVHRWPVERVTEVVARAAAAELGGVLLFGIPAEKDPVGSGASDVEGVVQRALREIRRSGYEGVVLADVCLCEYTDHGHCGLLDDSGSVRNDETLERLADVAVSQAAAGADVVAPSAMMDGQVGAIRRALDAAGHVDVAILGYSAKFASAFYGPFRDAVGSTPSFGDRRSYQMDPARGREALLEHAADLAEGADMLMVKPGLPYLDILRDSREAFPDHPIAVYNTSGEYSMVKAAAARGWIDESRVVLETLLGFRRAGADVVITYHALDAADWIHG
ncbi:MAG TPA: porphobilinogen synthase [Longimicrobiales bacterium]|nr:porphobilinogen synthase [Longimicrobiales bacterium]